MKTVKSNVGRGLCQRGEGRGAVLIRTAPLPWFRHLDIVLTGAGLISGAGWQIVQTLCRNVQTSLDFRAGRISIEVSPPIQFRIERADSQGMSPLLGCRPF
jgi:hypothetical protein